MTSNQHKIYFRGQETHLCATPQGSRARTINMLLVLGTMGLFLTASGCSKKAPAAAASPSEDAQAQAQPAPVQPLPAQPQPAPQQSALVLPNGQPDLAGLDRAMVRWLVGRRRPPANFEEFAATAGVAIPPPPPGKKYMIRKDMHIVLVDR
jgi:hypothetical protein